MPPKGIAALPVVDARQSENKVISIEVFRSRQSANTTANISHFLQASPITTKPVELGTQKLGLGPQSSGHEISMADPTRDEISAMISASEARNEIKLVRLEGKIDTLTATITAAINANATANAANFEALKEKVSASDQYNKDSRLVLIGTFVAGTFALAALFVALATYGDAIFGRGMNVRDVVQSVVREQQELQKQDVSAPASAPAAPSPPQGTTGKKGS